MLTKGYGEIQWLVKQVKPFVRLHLSSNFCIVVGSLLVLIDPLIMKWLIDDLIPHRRERWLLVAACAFLLAYCGRLVIDSLGGMLNFCAVQKMIFRLRLNLLRHLQRLSAEYHENKPVGETLHRLEQDVAQVGALSGEVLPSAFRMLMVSALVFGTMCVLNFRLTCIVLPLIPAFVLIRHRYHKRLRQCSDLVQEQSGVMSGFLQEHLSAIIQIQILSRELAEARRFARLSSTALQAQIKRKKTELVFSALLSSIILTGMASVLYYGGYQVITGSLSAGGLVAFYGFTVQLFIPLYNVIDIYSKLQRVRASIRRIMEIEETDTIIRDRQNAVLLTQKTPGAIELKNASFSYRSDRPVLMGISMRVNCGEKVALVGPSGNGKSTIAKLLARLYDVQDGAVLVDGLDIRDIKLKSLRSTIAYVPQDPILFDTSLRENLLYGNIAANQAELNKVASLAQLDGLIRRLPKGWNEPIGPRGSRLSGGERQRVALARAILQYPRILILDESTSALDAPIEKRFLEELDKFIPSLTTIFISHRAFAMQWADRVVVLSQGKIKEESNNSSFLSRERRPAVPAYK